MKNIREELVGSLIKRTYQIPEVFPIAGFKDALGGPLSAVVPVLIEMFEAKQVIGVSSVIRRVHEADDSISMKDWEAMLYKCVDSANSPHKVGAYVEEIRNSLISGMILDRASKILRAGTSEHVSADALMDILEETTLELRSSIMSQDRLDSGDAIDEIAAELREYRETGEVPMIFTGLWELDRMIGGFGDGEYIAISAMNGGGKSLLATGMMLFMSQARANGLKGRNTAFVSLEMTKADVYKRLIHQTSGHDIRKALASRTDADQVEEMFRVGNDRISSFNVNVVCPRSEDANSIKNLCRTLVANGAECIFLDYFQLMTLKGYRGTEMLERISAIFMRLAKELKVPIVMLCQQNSDAKSTENPHTGKKTGGVSREHISHCKKIARDAHTVILINEDMDKLIIDKSRNGMTGEIDIMFDVSRITLMGKEVDSDLVQI